MSRIKIGTMKALIFLMGGEADGFMPVVFGRIARFLPACCRTKTLKSGKLWVRYYYNGCDENGIRRQYSLGGDLNEGKRKRAEYECKPVPVDVTIMRHIFDRYVRDVLPSKALSTERENRDCIVSCASCSTTPHRCDIAARHCTLSGRPYGKDPRKSRNRLAVAHLQYGARVGTERQSKSLSRRSRERNVSINLKHLG
jgi:hypothetical protein